MAFNINQFRAEMVKDGARPNLFSVSVSFPFSTGVSSKLTFMAHATSLPPSIVGVASQYYFGRQVKFPGDRQFPDWSITVINDEDFIIRNAFEVWSDKLNSHSLNVRATGAINSTTYSADATVTQYGKDGSQIKTYKFVGLFPSTIDPIGLDWGSNDRIEEFNVTFSYQYWEAYAGASGGAQVTT
jgi:hypothetical protein